MRISFRPTRRALLAGAAALAAAPARAQPAPLRLDPRPGTLALPSGAVETLSFADGPAPLILRCKQGEPLTFDLAAPPGGDLSLHWMGMRIPTIADGAHPLAGPVAPQGGRARIAFVPPDPGFYWARPSGKGAGELLAKGLFAGLIVEERAPPPVDHDLVAVVKDWIAAPDARPFGDDTLPPNDSLGAGLIGDVVTVNGAPGPLALVARPNARVRLRLLNACNSRLLVATFSAARVQVIAIDGQPCDPFAPVRDTIPIGPGARFELMLDMPGTPGEAGAVLRGATPPDREPLPDSPLLAIRVEGAPLAERAPFEGLPLNPALPPAVRLQDAKRADLVISRGEIPSPEQAQAEAMGYRGGAKTHPRHRAPPEWTLSPPGDAQPLFTVKRGAPVSLGFVNNTAYPQTTHVRGHVMRLLHPLDDGWEPYWRDSVVTPAGKTSRVAFIADNPGKWLIENADPDRAAAGLSTWFLVT
jgi:FtsP/CotA-like multicopper oxidase with cupredoxin domain